MENEKHPTSWQKSSKWYDEVVGEQGHHYHQTIIIPKVLKLLDFQPADPASLLDLACGQGVLSRHLPADVKYVGVDVAPDLIRSAKQYQTKKTAQFILGDVTRPLPLKKEEKFSHCSIILALQNIKNAQQVIKNAHDHLLPDGKFVIVLNHPCFRIPRQSSWQIDEVQKLQYRRVNRYMTPMEIPIKTHPGKGDASPETVSFHHPLSEYFRWLHDAGFVVEHLEEWCSEKVSTGKAAKMENRCRSEFPLFLAILATR